MSTLDQRLKFSRRQVAALILLLALGSPAVQGAEPKAEPARPAVRLVIDYGDGVQLHFSAMPWREGMTALDSLTAMQKHPHGASFTQRGSGAAAMVTKIGDLKNEGDGKNWIFYINDKKSEVGAGGLKLKPGDAVLWKFETYDYNP